MVGSLVNLTLDFLQLVGFGTLVCLYEIGVFAEVVLRQELLQIGLRLLIL